MKKDPEPKDRMSDEWYAWKDRTTQAAYRTEPLAKVQRGLAGPSRPKGLDDLVGGTVTEVGFHPSANEGGLAIDFKKNGKPMRIVLGYTELGLWVYWVGQK